MGLEGEMRNALHESEQHEPYLKLSHYPEPTILACRQHGTLLWSLESWEVWYYYNRYAPMGLGSQMPDMALSIICSISK
ncbi:MAG: hypothetical protein JWQ98_3075 [Chlorobi bacterium]|nr:hypothetical protein [Chlorobiota bacterium]